MSLHLSSPPLSPLLSPSLYLHPASLSICSPVSSLGLSFPLQRPSLSLAVLSEKQPAAKTAKQNEEWAGVPGLGSLPQAENPGEVQARHMRRPGCQERGCQPDAVTICPDVLALVENLLVPPCLPLQRQEKPLGCKESWAAPTTEIREDSPGPVVRGPPDNAATGTTLSREKKRMALLSLEILPCWLHPRLRSLISHIS